MNAPDSPAVVNARREAEAQRSWGDPRVADTLDALLAELAEACRQPRVWLEGDEVPDGVTVTDESGAEVGEFWIAVDKPSRFDRDVVEIHVPDFAAAVAAERERRTIAAEPPSPANASVAP